MRPESSKSEVCSSNGSPEFRDLARLLDGLSYSCLTAKQPVQVTVSSITADSREVTASTLFVALAGSKTDGHQFIDQAIRNGCAAIIIENGKGSISEFKDADICVVAVEDSRLAYAAIAANFYDHPAREMAFIGITGTNGKTTVTYLLEHIFEQLGLPVGVIGTVNYRYSTPSGKAEVAAPFTTPEPLILQRLLRTMAKAGVRYVVMEASSHALFQNRLGDIQCDVAAFTNLSHDHLDYHADMEEYFEAKTRLFTKYLKKEGRAVITIGEAGQEPNWPTRVLDLCAKEGLHTSGPVRMKRREVRLIEIDSRRDGTTITLATMSGDITIATPLVGRFNVDNITNSYRYMSGNGVGPAKGRAPPDHCTRSSRPSATCYGRG